jgi:hypothetical protein
MLPERVEGGSVDSSASPPDGPEVDAASSFCTTTGVGHGLCADFDLVSTVAEGWLPVSGGTGAPPAFASEPLPLPSAPRDMRAVLEPRDGGTGASTSFVRKTQAYVVASGRPRARIELDFRVERGDVDGADAMLLLLGDPELGIGLALQGPGSSMLQVTAYERAIDTGAPVEIPRTLLSTVNMHEWTHLVLLVEARVDATTPPHALVTINGSTEAFDLAYLHPFGATFRADVGLAARGPSAGTWTVFYDNVLLDWQ